MSHSVVRYLAIDQGIVPGFFNFFINGGIAWWINYDREFMPFMGEPSIVLDTLATAFLLPLITCLIVTPLVIKKVRCDKLQPLTNAQFSAARLPAKSALVRGFFAGGLGVLCAAVPVLLVWNFIGPEIVSLHQFLWFKAFFAAFLGAFITALIAWWAIVDESQQQLRVKYNQQSGKEVYK